MSDSKKTTALLAKVSRLKQIDETWEGASRLGRCWITPKRKPPYRPYLIFFTRPSGVILCNQVLETEPTSDQIFEYLLQAMHRPMLGAGRACRPKRIYLNNPDHVAEIAPRLKPLEIDCQYRATLPIVNRTLASLEKSMNRGQAPFPGLLNIPSATPPLVNHLYELAAEFYRTTPWRWLDDSYPIEIHYPVEGKPRYAVVMGSGGEIFGLSVYDSLADLKLIYNPQLTHRQTSQQITWLVFYFDEAIAMSFDDLDNIEKYGWPVVNETAYPIFGRTTKQSTIIPPTAADMFWLEGALTGILTYFHDHKQIKNGILQPAEITMTVDILGTKSQLKLRLPAFERG